MSKLFIISGPAGVGKGTALSMILRKHPDFFVADSYTTRKPRKTETAIKKYHFVDQKTFEDLVKKGEILEWAKVHKWLYGTSKKSIQKALAENKVVFLEIDVKGGLNIKKHFKDACLIFLKYRSAEHLEKAVRDRILKDPKRKGVSEDEIKTRIKTAFFEMEYEPQYDYSIVNPEGQPEKAVKEVEKIIQKELPSS